MKKTIPMTCSTGPPIPIPRRCCPRFPGWDPRLVAAEPPFNEHLAGDAGAGFLATGAIVLLAAWWAERRAKMICAGCPVRTMCLGLALERREPWGVWGGQLFVAGVVVPRKRPRGRPRKDDVAA